MRRVVVRILVTLITILNRDQKVVEHINMNLPNKFTDKYAVMYLMIIRRLVWVIKNKLDDSPQHVISA